MTMTMTTTDLRPACLRSRARGAGDGITAKHTMHGAEVNVSRIQGRGGEEGFALLLTLIVTLIVGTLAITAVTVAGNASLITGYEERQSLLETVADAGLEEARVRLNANPSLMPENGYTTLENGVVPRDAGDTAIPGVRRWTYAGPVGTTTGQYALTGAVVSVAEAGNGDRAIRRIDVGQESLARYAYFTDVEGGISFGGGDRIQGPVHSNDRINILASRATFTGPGMVTTHQTITNRNHGTFNGGFKESHPRIEMPRTTELDRLKELATQGKNAFVAPNSPANGARMRIEFLQRGGHGWYRIYQSQNEQYLMARPHSSDAQWASSNNCGYHTGTQQIGKNNFQPTARMSSSWNTSTRLTRLKSVRGRCYLGGDEALNYSTSPRGSFLAQPAEGKVGSNNGGWVKRNWSLTGPLPSGFNSWADRDYLFPLNRAFNPNHKQVIHVTGDVAVSGRLRGRLTLAVTGDLYIVDDLIYDRAPGSAADCTSETANDMLGIVAGKNVIVANNTLTAPQNISGGSRPSSPRFPGTHSSYTTLGSSMNETIHAVILALNEFGSQNYDSPQHTNAELCEGSEASRGCLYLAGGIIQKQRGAVGADVGSSGKLRGYKKRYSYDACAAVNAPPFFPNVPRFLRSTYYEIDPVGFEPGAYFSRFSAQ